MYLVNKYTKWYNSIIANAQARIISDSTYTEIHHIIPRCFGGDDSETNLVKLTAREHFICHLLLTKMVAGKERSKMVLALTCMVRFKNNAMRHQPSSRQYEHIREQVSKTFSGAGNHMYGRKRTQGERDKISAAVKAANAKHGKRTHTSEAKDKISESKKGKARPQSVIDAMVAGRKAAGNGYDNNSGKRWFNDGVKSYLKHECPSGCVEGRLPLKQ